MRIKEIEARLAAIKKEIEERGDTMKAEEIDALEQETTQLTEERAGLIAAAEKRNGILDNIAKGAGIVSRTFEQKQDNADPDDPFGTPEYRSAWLKNLRRLPLTDAEKRAYANASGTGAEVVPTQTANEIISKVKKLAPMLNEVTLLHVKGAVKFVVEGTNNDAAIHTENAAITPAADTLTTVTLSGYEIVKLVQISDTVMTMSIAAFESWIVDMLAEAIARKVEDFFINGTGSSQPYRRECPDADRASERRIRPQRKIRYEQANLVHRFYAVAGYRQEPYCNRAGQQLLRLRLSGSSVRLREGTRSLLGRFQEGMCKPCGRY